MRKADVTDKLEVIRNKKVMRAALKVQRKDRPDMVCLLDSESLTPKAVWDVPTKFKKKVKPVRPTTPAAKKLKP